MKYCAVLLLSLCVALGAEPGGVKEVFDKGFAQFNKYNGNRNERMAGWTVMVQAAEEGYLPAKRQVAAFAAGFYTVNAPENQRGFFEPDLPLALRHLRDAVDLGNTEAMTRLALLYSSGIGEPRRDGESPQNLLLGAAKKGNRDAMIHLSDRYLHGHGVKRDLWLASLWRHRAEQDGEPSDLFVDEEYNARLQDTPVLNEFAELVSLRAKAARKDPAALKKLDQLQAARAETHK